MVIHLSSNLTLEIILAAFEDWYLISFINQYYSHHWNEICCYVTCHWSAQIVIIDRNRIIINFRSLRASLKTNANRLLTCWLGCFNSIKNNIYGCFITFRRWYSGGNANCKGLGSNKKQIKKYTIINIVTTIFVFAWRYNGVRWQRRNWRLNLNIY